MAPDTEFDMMLTVYESVIICNGMVIVSVVIHGGIADLQMGLREGTVALGKEKLVCRVSRVPGCIFRAVFPDMRRVLPFSVNLARSF